LKVGENVIAIQASNYRRRGQLPLVVSLDPKENVTDYRRELDLANAISTVTYKKDGVTYTREAFASAPDQVMVFRFTADKPGKVSFTATMDRLTASPKPGRRRCRSGDVREHRPAPAGVEKGMLFVARLQAMPRGQGVGGGATLQVDSADEVMLLVAAATDYQGFAGRKTADPLEGHDERHRIGKAAKPYDECGPPTSPTTAATSTG
jgi:alpha-L-fucosidase 2